MSSLQLFKIRENTNTTGVWKQIGLWPANSQNPFGTNSFNDPVIENKVPVNTSLELTTLMM